ncbi:MAG: hypothetical protein K0R01_54, partial [Mycobacterium sp.]|nr:hypothetical protein [Mycobacterium sp.]
MGRKRRRTNLLCVIAGASVVTLGAGGAVASPSSGAGDAVEEVCATSALLAGDAAQTAVRCGVEVEVVAERTPWDTTFATPEGLTRVESSA